VMLPWLQKTLVRFLKARQRRPAGRLMEHSR
jgi:hypothetical protein